MRTLRPPRLLAILTAAASLAGCYVVPIDTRQPPQVIYSPGGTAESIALPATQAQPVQLEARLYPVNDVAGKMGVLTALVSDNLNGHGRFTLNAGNETLVGEASRVGTEQAGFGNVYRLVYGETRLPAAGRRGIANAASGKGSYVNCEYVLTAAARGVGACLFSNGAKYQLHFGS
ncbi:MAG: hypothetical protein JNK96_11110 [Betaproteobacteria bacterium]|jgi:hypothetical protein|nr:hypothetical protein [Betaproteobacteria bacterium]HMV20226.1 hypothetical protein [Rhodocyclaceae bacterium]HMW77470.1 hypothetical protein [Rhodocyclaceae bacterium]HNE44073.1 hypothetical protein [Rhodocyclaceae bacterium]HNL22533.1 hypothetical protein [Rhodocyclaceae bacterium]